MTTDLGDGEQVGLEGGRRRLLAVIGRALVGGGVLVAAGRAPSRADTALDAQILQTASSLEALALLLYGIVLGEGPEGADAAGARALADAGAAVSGLARESRRQHGEHKKAFQAQTTAVGGRVQDAPNRKFLPLVAAADLSTPALVVELAATVEKVLVDSYVLNLPALQDVRSRAVMAGVLGVAAQRLATLRLVRALIIDGKPQLVAVPFPAGELLKLPNAAGSVATPDALHQLGGPDLVAEPASGAVS